MQWEKVLLQLPSSVARTGLPHPTSHRKESRYLSTSAQPPLAQKRRVLAMPCKALDHSNPDGCRGRIFCIYNRFAHPYSSSV